MKIRGAYGAKHPKTSPQTFGARLRRVRIAWGWSQAQLAEALGTEQPLVSQWERDIAQPSRAAMSAVATMLGLELEALLTGKDFSIPDIPAVNQAGSRTVSGKQPDLFSSLPDPVLGQVVIVEAGSTQENPISYEEAIKFLNKLKSQDKKVWLVVAP